MCVLYNNLIFNSTAGSGEIANNDIICHNNVVYGMCEINTAQTSTLPTGQHPTPAWYVRAPPINVDEKDEKLIVMCIWCLLVAVTLTVHNSFYLLSKYNYSLYAIIVVPWDTDRLYYIPWRRGAPRANNHMYIHLCRGYFNPMQKPLYAIQCWMYMYPWSPPCHRC